HASRTHELSSPHCPSGYRRCLLLSFSSFFFQLPPPPRSTLFPYTTLFRSSDRMSAARFPVGVTPAFRTKAARTSGGNTLCSDRRSEEHTSELQSRENLVCRLLLEKKNEFATTQRSRLVQPS